MCREGAGCGRPESAAESGGRQSGYGDFARAYDALTFNVPYDEIADYYAKTIRGVTDGDLLLDMGCGTGSLSVRLKERGFDVIGQDASADMLAFAAAKRTDVTWICQNMEETELGCKADAVISTLDSINHLPDKAAVERCFARVAENLKAGGAFAFDVNTPYKHREVLGENVFVYDVDGVYCVWQNAFCEEDCGVDIELDLFFEENDGAYVRGYESFREVAFPQEELCAMLESAGFEVVNVWEYLTFDEPNEQSEKLMFAAVLRK